MDTPTFNRMRGVGHRQRVDKGLYHARSGKGGGAAGGGDAAGSDGEDEDDDDDDEDFETGGKRKRGDAAAAGGARPKKKGPAAGGGRGDDAMYYRITCKDNGCGMPHDKMPDMLGRVLAGSKYGVRQTRGKFGLGAKMALIWSKKSTGLPIEVRSAHASARSTAGAAGGGDSSAATQSTAYGTDGTVSAETSGAAGGAASTAVRAPLKVSYLKLDIDIYKNVPHVHEHTLTDNKDGFVGTEISVTISGSWSSYKKHVLHYFQQLAVITPYAQFALKYADVSDKSSGGSNFSYVWRRRSTQIPRPPVEVKHHPSAVNDLLARQLVDIAKQRAATSTLLGFLTSQFSSIDRQLAQRLIRELGPGFNDAMPVAEMNTKQIHQLTSLMAVAKFPPPSPVCLSPAGEYNLRLGVMKELRPDLVATHSAPVSVFEGHPFIVEAAIALGGKGSEGITVHRFANRIPLLFEGGGDVATKTATKLIPWTKYKIDPVRDKVGVFVSLVSTKVPFKGTGKEYIGEDITEIRDAVREALLSCCAQLRVKLMRAHALRARANRRKNLAKYVPDVSRALLAALKSISARHAELGDVEAIRLKPGTGPASASGAASVAVLTPAAMLAASTSSTATAGDPLAKLRGREPIITEFVRGSITDNVVSARLLQAVEKADLDAALEQAAAATTGLAAAAAGDVDGAGSSSGASLFIAPARQAIWRDAPEVHHSACVIKFLPQALVRGGGGVFSDDADDE